MIDDLNIEEIILDDVQTDEAPPIDIEYPCFVVKSVEFEEELSAIKSDSGLPLYFEEDGNYQIVGNINPSVEVINRAKFFETGLEFRRDQNTTLDFNNFEDYLTFIVI